MWTLYTEKITSMWKKNKMYNWSKPTFNVILLSHKLKTEKSLLTAKRLIRSYDTKNDPISTEDFNSTKNGTEYRVKTSSTNFIKLHYFAHKLKNNYWCPILLVTSAFTFLSNNTLQSLEEYKKFNLHNET